jgi:hypothetical protein
MSERDTDTQHITVDALGRIRDNALLLILGNTYLCEEPFLIKIGSSIDVHLEKLKEDISYLKSKFPGKFTHEVDTDQIIEEIHSTAQSLKEPDEELNERCTVGELGRDLETSIATLSDAIKVIRGQIDGSGTTYTTKDSVIKLAGGFQALWSFIKTTITVSLKILIGLILVAILPIAYLLFTMETEGRFLKELVKSQTQIQVHEDIVSQIDLKKEELSQKIKSLEKGTPSRQDKVEIMDLEIEIHRIDNEREKSEYEIDTHKKKAADYQRRIKEIKETPFTQRYVQHMKNVVGDWKMRIAHRDRKK